MPKKILLIEEDAGLRRKWQKFLEWEHFEVKTTSSIESATRLIQDELLDVELLIVAIPEPSTETRSEVEELLHLIPQGKVLLVLDSIHYDELPYPAILKPFYPEYLVLRVKRLLTKPGYSGQVSVSA